MYVIYQFRCSKKKSPQEKILYETLCMYNMSYACTVQLTRNLNASVEYERFYSRVSMCETRASFTRRSDPSHSSTRALVLVLERSSTRTRLERSSTSTRLELAYSLDIEFARSNIVHEGSKIIYPCTHRNL